MRETRRRQSDLHHLERETWLKPPAVLGHEGAGVVKTVGVNVTRAKPGDHVIIAVGPQCAPGVSHNSSWIPLLTADKRGKHTARRERSTYGERAV